MISVIRLVLQFNVNNAFRRTRILRNGFTYLQGVLVSISRQISNVRVLQLSSLSCIVLTMFLSGLMNARANYAPVFRLVVVNMRRRVHLLTIYLRASRVRRVIIRKATVRALRHRQRVPNEDVSNGGFELLRNFLRRLLTLLPVRLPVRLTRRNVSRDLRRKIFHFRYFHFRPLRVKYRQIKQGLSPRCDLPCLDHRRLTMIFHHHDLKSSFLRRPCLTLELILLDSSVDLFPRIIMNLDHYLRRNGRNCRRYCGISFRGPVMYCIGHGLLGVWLFGTGVRGVSIFWPVG